MCLFLDCCLKYLAPLNLNFICSFLEGFEYIGVEGIRLFHLFANLRNCKFYHDVYMTAYDYSNTIIKEREQLSSSVVSSRQRYKFSVKMRTFCFLVTVIYIQLIRITRCCMAQHISKIHRGTGL